MISIRHFFPALCILLILPLTFAAQEDFKNFIGLSFGGSDFHIKDEKASPLIFSNFGIAPALQFIHTGENNRHILEIKYLGGDLKSAANNFLTTNNRGNIRYSYLHAITDFNILKNRITFYLGGSANTFLSHSDYYFKWFNGGNAKASESWYWSTSLDISAGLEYHRVPREFITVQFFIPVISNVSRPDFSPSHDYNYVENDWKFKMFGETEFFPDNFSIGANLVYQRPLIWDLNLLLNYEFFYSSYERPKSVNMYMNNLRAGLFYCF